MINDLNGHRVSLTDATISFQDEVMLGASEVKANEKLEPGEVDGAASVPVGYTTGPWSGTTGFKAPLAEALRMQAALGGSFGGKLASASFTFTALDSSDGVNTIEFPSLRITSCDLDGGDRSKAASIGFEAKLLEPGLWNGVRIVDLPNTSDGVGFLLSLFGG